MLSQAPQFHTRVIGNIPASASTLWAYIIQNPDWHPRLEKVEFRGNMKIAHLKSGGLIFERNVIDHERLQVRYRFLRSPFPYRDYVATFRILSNGPQSCLVDWSCSYLPDGISNIEADSMIRQCYQDGIDSLTQAIQF